MLEISDPPLLKLFDILEYADFTEDVLYAAFGESSTNLTLLDATKAIYVYMCKQAPISELPSSVTKRIIHIVNSHFAHLLAWRNPLKKMYNALGYKKYSLCLTYANHIWYEAGDVDTDINYYTKRLILSSPLYATLNKFSSSTPWDDQFFSEKLIKTMTIVNKVKNPLHTIWKK